MNLKFRVIGIFVLLSGCVTGPVTEKKNSLDVLNGKNYDVGPGGPADTILVPVIKRKERASQVNGEVRIDSGIAPTPVRYVSVGLYNKEGQLIAQTTTDSNGEFQLSGVIPNGTYHIKVLSEKYVGSLVVSIKDYEMNGIVVKAEKNRAQ